jgi:hypothetical protein
LDAVMGMHWVAQAEIKGGAVCVLW